MFFKFLADNIELKPCPFCGGTDLEIGVSENPFIMWDGAIRGERVAYIVCECGTIMKHEAYVHINDIFDDDDEIKELKQELIECAEKVAQKWNERSPH